MFGAADDDSTPSSELLVNSSTRGIGSENGDFTSRVSIFPPHALTCTPLLAAADGIGSIFVSVEAELAASYKLTGLCRGQKGCM